MWQVRGELEALGQTDEESAARPELRSADAYSSTVADQIDLVQQIDNIDAQFEPPIGAGEGLHDAEVDLLIAWQAGSVGGSARVGGPETTAGGEVDGKAGHRTRVLVLDAGRVCVGLVVIEMDVVAGDKCEFVRIKVELRRDNIFPLRLGSGKISVERPVFDIVAEAQFDAANQPLLVIE